MLRVSVTLHPATGGPPREVAAVAIAQRGRRDGGPHRYVAVSAVDGLDGDVERGAIVDHDRGDGVLRLVELVIAGLSVEDLEELAEPVRQALRRRAILTR